MRWITMFTLFVLTLGLTVLSGCPPTNDDDDSDGSGGSALLCSGTSCVNTAGCPAAEPAAGDPCSFTGNCHYCVDGSRDAEGYTCDGTSFTYQGTFACDG